MDAMELKHEQAIGKYMFKLKKMYLLQYLIPKDFYTDRLFYIVKDNKKGGGHRGWKGPFNTFSKNIFSKRVSIDQNGPNDQILCMDHYVG